MQFKIYKRLNLLLNVMILSIIAMIVGVVLNFNKLQDQIIIIFVFFFLYSVVCFYIFKLVENNYDKRLIQKMAIANQVVIANIKEAKIAFPIKDSGGKHYNLWEITVTYIDHDMNSHDFVFYEKLNPSVQTIPHGTVFMTNDEKKPGRKFIVPNVIISHIESMMPIVHRYEKEKKAFIKYLNVYYDNGLIIETYNQSLKKEKEEQEKKENAED